MKANTSINEVFRECNLLGREVDGLSTHLTIRKIDPEESLWLGEGDKVESLKTLEGHCPKERKVHENEVVDEYLIARNLLELGDFDLSSS